jgi:hypothetical protein
MSKPEIPPGLSVHELLGRFLDEQTRAHSSGLGLPETDGDAGPHDTAPVQPADPRQAWKDACALLSLNVDPPSDWPQLVSHAPPALSVAFSLGNFPQMVRNVSLLLMSQPVSLREDLSPGAPRPALTAWAGRQTGAARLLAAGALRQARLFDEAAEILNHPVSEDLEPGRQNELAALLWHRGSRKEALAAWKKLEPSVAVAFNLGMAQLFLGDPRSAIGPLQEAQSQLPEDSPWHHLAGLYLAVASGAE